MQEKTYRIVVCRGPDCSARNSQATHEKMAAEIKKRGLEGRVKLLQICCFGKCRHGPNVVIGPRKPNVDSLFGEEHYFDGEPGECMYCHVTTEEVASLIEEHIGRDCPMERLLWKEGMDETEDKD